jgi:hypothetical protein
MAIPGSADTLYKPASLRTAVWLSAGYLLLSKLLIGFKTEQLYLVLLFNTLFFASRITRKFITGFSIFIVFWILFDYMKAFPNYLYQDVHIGSLYSAEKNLFGIHTAQALLTPNEYWLQHTHPALDLLTGFAYLCWVPVPLLFAGTLFFRNRSAFLQFSLTFLFVNLIGFALYYIYPAAPPWYVQQHGFDFIAGTPGNTGGLARFDTLLHTKIFDGLYSKSSNVFAAMPSLHAAYPLIVFYFGIRYRMGWINLFFLLLMGGIWFAAVYNSHHYILDILAGISCAILGIFTFRWLTNHSKPVQRFLAAFHRVIA